MRKTRQRGLALLLSIICLGGLAGCIQAGESQPPDTVPDTTPGIAAHSLPVSFDFSVRTISMTERLYNRLMPAMPDRPLKKAEPPAYTNTYWIQPYYDYDMASQVVGIINRYRREQGLPDLAVGTGLTNAAAIRAVEIVSYYSHTRPNGSRFFTALTGINAYSSVAENLVYGYNTAEDIMTVFMASEGHKNNILGDFTHVGVRVYRAGNGKYYCGQMFGKARDSGGTATASSEPTAANEGAPLSGESGPS